MLFYSCFCLVVFVFCSSAALHVKSLSETSGTPLPLDARHCYEPVVCHTLCRFRLRHIVVHLQPCSLASSSRPASATPEASPSSCLVVTCLSTHNAPFCYRHRYLGASGLEKHPAKRGHTWYFNRFSSSQVLRAHLPLSSGKPSATALLVDFVRIKIKDKRY